MPSHSRATPVVENRRPNAATRRAAAGGGGGRGRPRSEEAERAILDATLALLGETGISGLTVEAIAARAGVGKATIYRRWPSKLPLVVNAIKTLPELPVPNTGTLRGDLREIVRHLARILQSSPLGRVLPHLIAEGGWDAQLDEAIRHYVGVRRVPLVEVVRRAVERGEVSTAADPEALADLLAGPIVNRLFFSRRPIEGKFLDLVVRTVLAEMTGATPRTSSTDGGRQA
jgi:AcrR family transcriptional regulator